MHPNNILRPTCRRSNRIDILIGRVSCKNGSGLADRIEFREDFFFEVKVFKHCLNDQIHIGNIVIVGRTADRADQLLHFIFAEFALLYGYGVILADNAKTTLQRLVINLNQHHRYAHSGKAHGDASTHCATTDNGHFLDVSGGRIFRQVLNLGSHTLREEYVAHRR